MSGLKAAAAAWLLALQMGGLCAQETPRATAEHGAFALPDPGGKRRLIAPGLEEPGRLRTALCESGARLAVRYERRQAGKEGSAGRQRPADFDQLAGDVFAVTDGTSGESASCFLAADSLLTGAAVLRVTPGGRAACGEDLRNRINSTRRRPVVHCWQVGRIGEKGQIALAEFVRQDKDALASLVLSVGGRMIFADYPAVFRGEGEDLWRADDGGVLTPEGMRVVFVLERGTSYVMGVRWQAAEGAALSLFVSDGADRFRGVLSDYWYQAPL